MKFRKNLPNVVLFLIFIFSFVLRLYIGLKHGSLGSGEDYFNLRLIGHIFENKWLMVYDFLSYGGRELVYSPLYYIVMAIFGFGNLLWMKILNALFASSVVFLLYLLIRRTTENKWSAILGVGLFSFLPIFMQETTNSLTVYSLFLPCLLLFFYSFFRFNHTFFRGLFLVLCVVLPLIHPISFLVVIAFLFYLFLMAGGALTPSNVEKENIFVASLSIVLFIFVIYKKVLVEYGVTVILGGLPVNVLFGMFREISAYDLFFGIGFIPLVLGLLGLYVTIFKIRDKVSYLFSGLLLGVILLLLVGWIGLFDGLLFFGLSLCVLSAKGFDFIIVYLRKLKFLKESFWIVIIILFLILLGLSSYFVVDNLGYVDDGVVDDLKFIESLVDSDDIVLSGVEEGHLVSYFIGAKNVADTNFLLANNALERVDDIETIFTTWNSAKVIELLNKYEVDIIYYSRDLSSFYGLDIPDYFNDENCFGELREGIYEFKC